MKNVTTTVSLVISAAALLTLSACQTVPYQGTARDVKVKPQSGGIVAVPTNPRAEDRARAQEHMAQTCAPNPYKITEEGESVTGQVTDTNSSTTRRDDQRQQGNFMGMNFLTGQNGGNDQQAKAVTKNMTEWQISYECAKPAGKSSHQ